MSFKISTDEKKSLGLAILVYGLLLLILFLFRFWPPANMKLIGGGGGGGIEMNFGDTDFGMGDNYKSEVLNVKDQAKVTPVKTTPDEDVISDDNADNNDVVIPKKENIKKTPVGIKKDVKPVAPKPTVSKSANDALSSILGNKNGDGNDTKAGNKGNSNGNLNTKGYYGNGSGNGNGNGPGTGPSTGPGYGPGTGGGTGGGTGYLLGNRKALNKPQPDYTCQEQGRVAVQVSVDRNGNTISVTAGVQGTTNTAKCLLDQARIAAINTKWQADSNAPEKQVGKIIYTFSLN
ncbi:MAG: energy transducer TonB [Flavobacterium sp.]|nr:energy transducer TonB [Flavobacterium sp.]